MAYLSYFTRKKKRGTAPAAAPLVAICFESRRRHVLFSSCARSYRQLVTTYLSMRTNLTNAAGES